MGLYCGFDGDTDGFDWWWQWDRKDPKPLETKRSRKCCSCGAKIAPGTPAATIHRLRHPNTDVEARIYGEDGEVYMADWHLCETCSDLAVSLDELGFCFDLGMGNSLKEQIEEYRAEERLIREQQALRTGETPNLEVRGTCAASCASSPAP